jgi:hypothetical protein
MSLSSIHNDYLDPDKHLGQDEEPETEETTYADSPCRVNLNDLQRDAEEAIRFIERNPKLFSCSWKELFEHAPKGEFDWTQEEAGDWIPSDGEGDGNWEKYAYATNLARRADGTEVVEFTSVDSDGNWDTSALIERKPKSRLKEYEQSELAFEQATTHCYYNLLKQALYSIYVARTGEDPLEDTLGNADPREVHLRNLAHEVPDLCASVYRTATKQLLAS